MRLQPHRRQSLSAISPAAARKIAFGLDWSRTSRVAKTHLPPSHPSSGIPPVRHQSLEKSKAEDLRRRAAPRTMQFPSRQIRFALGHAHDPLSLFPPKNATHLLARAPLEALATSRRTTPLPERRSLSLPEQ